MNLPTIFPASKLGPNVNRLYVGAYGFEERSLGWGYFQSGQGPILRNSLIFRYKNPKGKNRTRELRQALLALGVPSPNEAMYDARFPHKIEQITDKAFDNSLLSCDEIVLDISAMTKLLILVCLCKLKDFVGTMRIVYSEAEDYSPSKQEYEASRKDVEVIATYPSRGSEYIVRTRCLSSIRMQGQPVSMVAFTSFNEQLVRHMLGTINPHRLIFINGRSPRIDYDWRERATQEIYNKLLNEYRADNELDAAGSLKRIASTLDYRETVYQIDEIHRQFGTHERIICAATGSKMQTVGLFFTKIIHPDIHIEYPTPDSYFVKRISIGVRKVHEVVLPRFADFLRNVHE